jgi:hypothetical protein
MPSAASTRSSVVMGNCGGDVAVVEDLMEARAQELSECDTRLAGIGSAERSAGVEGAGFAYGNGHVGDLEPFELSSGKNLVSLWMTVDNSQTAATVVLTAVMRNAQSYAPTARLDGCDDKRTPRDPSRYFLPCILTASIAAAAASGSR